MADVISRHEQKYGATSYDCNETQLKPILIERANLQTKWTPNKIIKTQDIRIFPL